MSVLEKVKQDLYANQEIVVIDIEAKTDLIHSTRGAETVKIVVAPKKGLYTADELQQLMLRLTKQDHTMLDSFHDWEKSMEFGKLYFDEDIGIRKMRAETTLTDDDLLAREPKEFEQGKLAYEWEETLTRRTWVYLYPNARIALRAVQDGEDVYRIDRADLERFRGRFARIIARLGLRP